MYIADFKEAFDSQGYLIEKVLMENYQSLEMEFKYFNAGGLAKVSDQDCYGNLAEAFVFCRTNKKPKASTVFNALQRSQARTLWYKEDAQEALALDQEILKALTDAEEGTFVVFRLTPDGDRFVYSYHDTLEECVRTIVKEYEI